MSWLHRNSFTVRPYSQTTTLFLNRTVHNRIPNILPRRWNYPLSVPHWLRHQISSVASCYRKQSIALIIMAYKEMSPAGCRRLRTDRIPYYRCNFRDCAHIHRVMHDQLSEFMCRQIRFAYTHKREEVYTNRHAKYIQWGRVVLDNEWCSHLKWLVLR